MVRFVISRIVLKFGFENMDRNLRYFNDFKGEIRRRGDRRHSHVGKSEFLTLVGMSDHLLGEWGRTFISALNFPWLLAKT